MAKKLRISAFFMGGLLTSVLFFNCAKIANNGGLNAQGNSEATQVIPTMITASLIEDLNNDGKNDLVISSQGNNDLAPFILFNQGNDVFKKDVIALPEQYKGQNGSAVDIKSGDFNGDGKTDLLLLVVESAGINYYGSAQVQLVLGDGHGLFRAAPQNISNSTWPKTCGIGLFIWPDHIRVADIDGDSHLDFIVTSPSSCGGIIFRNDGSGNFAPANISIVDGSNTGSFASLTWWRSSISGSHDTDARAGDVIVGDINKDGKPDFFAPTSATHQSNPASIQNATFINTSTQGHLSFNVVHSPTVGALRNGALLDINLDGNLDFVGSLSISGSTASVPIVALLGDGLGHFTPSSSVILPSTADLVHASAFIAADFNHDTKSDLLIADTGYDNGNFPGRRNWLFINNGSGVLEDKAATHLDLLPTYTHQGAVGDLNGDGHLDLVLNNAGCNGTSMVCSNGPLFWRNDGNSAFKSFNPKIQ
jgi:hypothetical protein